MLKQPVGQKLLTNIAVVKLKKQGKLFELACYRNKVTDWRNKTEGDVNSVLQIDQIYTNVERGTVASKAELKKFGKMSRDEIIIEILNKGEQQMTDMERGDKLENLKLDIANWISQQCINAENNNQFPSSIILRAMKEVNCKVVQTKTAKQQALSIVQELKRVLPIERARMHVKITFQTLEQSESFLKSLQEGHAESHTVDLERPVGETVEVFMTIEKSLYRVIQDLLKKESKLYVQVIVEIQDPDLFKNTVQSAAGQGNKQAAAVTPETAQAAMASMSIAEDQTQAQASAADQQAQNEESKAE